MTNNKLPIFVVDLKKQDRNRVRYACSVFRVHPTDEQADQIANHLHPLPADDDDLIDKVSECIAIDWESLGEKPDDTLRRLSIRLAKARVDFYPSKRIRQEMFVATRGLLEHPEWYSDECMCAECRSCGD